MVRLLAPPQKCTSMELCTAASRRTPVTRTTKLWCISRMVGTRKRRCVILACWFKLLDEFFLTGRCSFRLLHGRWRSKTSSTKSCHTSRATPTLTTSTAVHPWGNTKVLNLAAGRTHVWPMCCTYVSNEITFIVACANNLSLSMKTPFNRHSQGQVQTVWEPKQFAIIVGG